MYVEPVLQFSWDGINTCLLESRFWSDWISFINKNKTEPALIQIDWRYFRDAENVLYLRRAVDGKNKPVWLTRMNIPVEFKIIENEL